MRLGGSAGGVRPDTSTVRGPVEEKGGVSVGGGEMRLVGVEQGLDEGMTRCLRRRCQNGAWPLARLGWPCRGALGRTGTVSLVIQLSSGSAHFWKGVGHGFSPLLLTPGPPLLVEGLILLEHLLECLLLEDYPSQGVTPSWILACVLLERRRGSCLLEAGSVPLSSRPAWCFPLRSEACSRVLAHRQPLSPRLLPCEMG